MTLIIHVSFNGIVKVKVNSTIYKNKVVSFLALQHVHSREPTIATFILPYAHKSQ